MIQKLKLLSFMGAWTLLYSQSAAFGQDYGRWIRHQGNQIRNEESMGLLNPSQAQSLMNQQNAIRQQEQQFRMQDNGGSLTTNQRQTIDSEMRNLNGNLAQQQVLNGDYNRPLGYYGTPGYGNYTYMPGTTLPGMTLGNYYGNFAPTSGYFGRQNYSPYNYYGNRGMVPMQYGSPYGFGGGQTIYSTQPMAGGGTVTIIEGGY